MIPVFRLIRLPNLIIIALTMILMRFGILQPLFNVNDLNLELPELYFIFLVVAVVLIAAAGYIINDYFDVDTDTVNCPDKVLIGKYFTADAAYYSYIALNSIAMALALFVSIKATSFAMFLIFPLTAGILWFYSTTYKRQLLLGNLLVSILIAIVPFIPAIYEIPLVFNKYNGYIQYEEIHLPYIYFWIGSFSLFAFLVNFIREIVKDAEDYAGDKLTGCRTLAVVFGIRVSKVVILVLIGVTILILSGFYIFFLLFNKQGKIDFITLGYFAVFLIIPLITTAVYIYKANETSMFARASTILKIVLVFGVLYALVLRYKIIL